MTTKDPSLSVVSSVAVRARATVEAGAGGGRARSKDETAVNFSSTVRALHRSIIAVSVCVRSTGQSVSEGRKLKDSQAMENGPKMAKTKMGRQELNGLGYWSHRAGAQRVL